MGGIGSGRRRRAGSKRLVDHCLTVDVNAWNRADLLVPGHSFSWTWMRAGAPIATIDVVVLLRAVELSYTVGGMSRELQSVRYSVPTLWTPCRFGGQRPWLFCPRCGRRVVKLFLYGRYFCCRDCHGLAYESQRADAGERAVRRATKIRQLLGGSSDLVAPFPEKPPGMRWRTYDRLVAVAMVAEHEAAVTCSAWTASAEQWLNGQRRDR